MRIGVFSDTHGNISNAKRFMNILTPLDCIFHLGDYASDGEKLSSLFSCPVYTVRGNCDYLSSDPFERIVTLENKRFLLIHGHQYYSMTELMYRGGEVFADMVLYGHTHVPDLSADGSRLFLNPGSLSCPRRGYSESCTLVMLEDNNLTVRFVNSENATGCH